MKLRLAHLLALCALTVISAAPAFAQADEAEKLSIGLGGGITQTDIGNQPYWMLNARFRAGYRSTGEEHQGAITGFVEPEIGYWKSTNKSVHGSDTLVGVNLIGAFPFSAAESFLGVGVGAHFVDSSLLENSSNVKGSETKLGVNAQFGLDLRLTRSLSAFGTGRFDLVQGAKDNVQSKVYLGLRARL